MGGVCDQSGVYVTISLYMYAARGYEMNAKPYKNMTLKETTKYSKKK